MGTVMKIDMRSGRSLPNIVFIHFDQENVGRGAKIKKQLMKKHVWEYYHQMKIFLLEME